MIARTFENNISSYINELEKITILDKGYINNIEDKITCIIEEDKKLDIPVFSFIENKTISKLAYFLSGSVDRSLAIGVAGETASGKSTFTNDVLGQIIHYQKSQDLQNLITRLNTDDYYYDRSEMVKDLGGFQNFCKAYDLDVPNAFELDLLKKHIEQLVLGNDVMLPKYDMSGTAKRHDNVIKAVSSPLIVTEGLFTLTEKIIAAFDLTIYVDVSSEAQKERFFIRAEERGLGDSAKSVLQNAISKAETYIRPTRDFADIVINGEATRENYINIAKKFVLLADKLLSEKQLVK